MCGFSLIANGCKQVLCCFDDISEYIWRMTGLLRFRTCEQSLRRDGCSFFKILDKLYDTGIVIFPEHLVVFDFIENRQQGNNFIRQKIRGKALVHRFNPSVKIFSGKPVFCRGFSENRE